MYLPSCDSLSFKTEGIKHKHQLAGERRCLERRDAVNGTGVQQGTEEPKQTRRNDQQGRREGTATTVANVSSLPADLYYLPVVYFLWARIQAEGQTHATQETKYGLEKTGV